MLQEDKYRLSQTQSRNQPQRPAVPAAIPRETEQGSLREIPSTLKPPLHYYIIRKKAGAHGNVGASHRLCTPVLHRPLPKGSAVANMCREGKKERTVARWQHCSLPPLQRDAVAIKTSTTDKLKKPQTQKKTQWHESLQVTAP